VIIRPYRGKAPKIAPSAFIADGVVIIGDVEIGEHASVWYNCVLRADVGHIRVGARSNVQDGSCLHMTSDLSHAVIGQDVTVGHNAIVHGATVEDGALIGMGSILLDNAVIGRQSLIAAGTVVPPRMIVPAYSLVRGQPGKVVRELNDAERLQGTLGAAHYVELAAEHAKHEKGAPRLV
jgi:carbonic anhydrase/acetyltransferase-like protein (isoleucine patch superfamily)